MALSKKQMLIGGGVLLAGAGAFLLFRKPTKKFYDNVWCNEDCQNIEDCFGGAQGYINSGGVSTVTECQSDRAGNGTGAVNLLFPEPHNLKVGDKIFIQQKEGATYPEYNRGTTVNKIHNKYIIEVPIARRGSSGVEGGVVTTSSIWNKISPF
tara:strand:- start:3474 stop:3932 length:459 start_codon:yes stop_codon:yes gene_type:complete